MSKKNVAQETQKRIVELQEQKAAELEKIDNKLKELQTKKENLEESIEKATEQMNLKLYKAAEQELKETNTAINMYSGRYKQIKEQKYISESESDKVINNLLSYEKELDQDFINEIKEPLNELKQILANYFGAVQETEKTIRRWERQIHANYSTRGATIWTDPVTGKRTDRSDKPVFVHNPQYEGCSAAHILKEYLNKAPFKKL